MLLTFRLFLGGASLVILALAVIARGLIPMPEVRTRVGEVPTLGRSLIQEAMILRAFIDVSDGPTGKAEETKAVRELSHSDVALAPAAATTASPASEPASAAESRETGSRPSGDLAPVLLPETQSVHALPEVASTGETQAPSGAPALAFAAENLTAPITGEGGERAGAAQSKARRHQAKADGPHHHRSGKRTKKVGTSKQKLAANSAEVGSLGVNVSASPSPKTAGPRPPHLVGRLLHPESLTANRRVGELTAHSASVLAGRIEQTHKLQDNRREVKIWGFRATPDVKARGELPVE